MLPMGRPPKGDRARLVVISFRATDEEESEIRAAARLTNKDRSEIVLRGALVEARRILREKGRKPV